jgi:hypothetical protein
VEAGEALAFVSMSLLPVVALTHSGAVDVETAPRAALKVIIELDGLLAFMPVKVLFLRW